MSSLSLISFYGHWDILLSGEAVKDFQDQIVALKLRVYLVLEQGYK